MPTNTQITLDQHAAMELDERQRATLHAASHKAFRNMRFALFVAFVVLSFRYDDIVITLTLGAIAAVGMLTQWFYLRKAGVDKEIESVQARDRLQRGALDKRAPIFGFYMTVMSLGTMAVNDGITWGDVVSSIVAGVFMTLVMSMIERQSARQVIEREAGIESASYSRGRRIGNWLARIAGRKQ